MSASAVLLVLASALLHPIRDVLLMRTGHRESAYLLITVAWIGLSLAAALAQGQPLSLPEGVWPLALLSAMGLTLYYAGIAHALRHGDLSAYYPIIRSSPLFIVGVGALFLDRSFSGGFLIGVGLVVTGAILIQRPPDARTFGRLDLLAVAVLAMAGSGLYTLADEAAMKAAPPAAFLFWVYVLVLAGMTGFFTWRRPSATPLLRHLTGAARTAPGRVAAAALASFVSYYLILIAFAEGAEAAHVAALRQASIPFSVLLGALLLKEAAGLRRLLWSLMMAAGLVAIVAG